MQSLNLLHVAARKRAADCRSRRIELARLFSDHIDVFVFKDIVAGLKTHILELTLTDIHACARKYLGAEHLCRVIRDTACNQLECLGIEDIAGKNRRRHVPDTVNGRNTAACRVVVHDIVMDERESMGNLKSESRRKNVA